MRIQELDYSLNLLQALLWQYNETKSIQSLVSQKQAWYNENQSNFWTDWYNNVFNLQTANDFGLAVWSIILNVPLYLPVVTAPNKPVFGFGPYNQNYYRSNFANINGINNLTIPEARLVLRMTYFKLVSRAAIPEINQFLNTVFSDYPPGSVYVLDGLNMTITCVFKFFPTQRMLQIFKAFDLIPRGAAVGIKYINISKPVFGFGPFNQNYHNSNFMET